jgi:hypothetical protein
MDKKTAGMVGAVAGMAALGSAQAALPPAASVAEALHATSYAELLAPVENAVAVLKVDDAARSQDGFQTVQYGYYGQDYAESHHHHHHHAQYRPPPPRHHHHHHHHHNYGGDRF